MKSMSATKLRLLLAAAMALMTIAAIVGFYFAHAKLSEYATSISRLNAQAQSGNDDIRTLESLEAKMSAQAVVIAKARSIVAQSQQYRYQDQIVRDLSRIAGNNGVVITQFNFSSVGAQSAAPGVADTGVPSGSAGAPVPSPGSPVSSLKSETVTVTIKSPLPYDNLMNFIRSIERNPLKMQIARIALVKDEGANVSSETFTIEVYVR